MKTPKNYPKCEKCLKSFKKLPQDVKNTLKYQKIPPKCQKKITKCCKISQNVVKYHKMSKNIYQILKKNQTELKENEEKKSLSYSYCNHDNFQKT